jgi:hypothetical protein
MDLRGERQCRVRSGGYEVGLFGHFLIGVGGQIVDFEAMGGFVLGKL